MLMLVMCRRMFGVCGWGGVEKVFEMYMLVMCGFLHTLQPFGSAHTLHPIWPEHILDQVLFVHRWPG